MRTMKMRLKVLFIRGSLGIGPETSLPVRICPLENLGAGGLRGKRPSASVSPRPRNGVARLTAVPRTPGLQPRKTRSGRGLSGAEAQAQRHPFAHHVVVGVANGEPVGRQRVLCNVQ